MKHMNNKVLLYKNCYSFYCNISWRSQGTLQKKKQNKTKHVNEFIEGTLTICACEYWWEGKSTLSSCLVLLCKQQTVFLSDIQQASRIVQEEFTFWLLVREEKRKNFNASPYHYSIGSFIPAWLALALTLVWKHQDCPLSAIHSTYRCVINPWGKDSESTVRGTGILIEGFLTIVEQGWFWLFFSLSSFKAVTKTTVEHLSHMLKFGRDPSCVPLIHYKYQLLACPVLQGGWEPFFNVFFSF